MSDYAEQDDLNKVRKKFEADRIEREKEVQELLELLSEAEDKFAEAYNASLDKANEFEEKERLYNTPEYLEDHPAALEVLYGMEKPDYDESIGKLNKSTQYALEWVWKIKRRLHEIARQEREDLQWIWRLEDRPGKPTEEISRPPSNRQARQRKRAEAWKKQQSKGNPEN